ncbi:CbiX/SirB N-terminal domain-containing protein [Halomonas vilamensis]|uniref:CbiX/SirB N-terminal domain-containing protein n=1 Tax=Vreelandella vilamensis TaxID=531309 RepID=A0ABU1H304_9GAMM|nr:CbiX/SirB N-terminal domain-containing protein [Halomonas vilamensis]MDR5898670.1 CbiX/SirB N-terminal domain-containing protein [Halomonas vilamensis]
MRAIFLTDNGSLRPQATFNLRRVAEKLSKMCGEPVQAASLLHANKIPAEQLGGEPAITLGPAATRAAEQGASEIVVVPFFFGPSRALTDYLPQRMGELQARFPHVAVKVAKPLVDERGAVDLRLAQLLADNVRERMASGEPPKVVLVDHGSPIPEVTAVRNRLAGQLSVLLANETACVCAASMERREGEAYRFNEPLLQHLLADASFHRGEVVLAMLFLSPGRHAGEGGDIASICAAATQAHPALRVVPTRLVGEHDGITAILASRLEAVDSGEVLLMLPALGAKSGEKQ